MIWYYIILFVTTILTAAFDWIPKVTVLPTVGGIDLDANLLLAMGYFYTFIDTFWPIHDLFIAVLFYLGYLAIKNVVLKLFLGHRAPA